MKKQSTEDLIKEANRLIDSMEKTLKVIFSTIEENKEREKVNNLNKRGNK